MMNEPKGVVAYGQRCLLCRNDAAESRVICWKHIDDIRDMLDVENEGRPLDDLPPSIPVMFSALDATPGPAPMGERPAPGYESTPPLLLHVVAMRDDRSRSPEDEGDDSLRPIAASLRGIVDSIRSEVDGLAPSSGTGVFALCMWLSRHLSVVSRLPWVDDLYRDLRELSDQLRAAHGDGRPRPLGHCTNTIVVPGERDGEHRNMPCGHALYRPRGVKPTAPDEPVRDIPAVECGRCHARYDGLAQLRLRIAELKGSE